MRVGKNQDLGPVYVEADVSIFQSSVNHDLRSVSSLQVDLQCFRPVHKGKPI